jgi:hypothetical protein
MLWLAESARKRAWACFVAVGAGSVAGLLTGSGPGLAQTKDLSPAQVVAQRFPAAWHTATPRSPNPVTTVPKQSLFDPNPTYALASADSQPILPRGLLAYGDTGAQPPVEARASEAAPAEATTRTVAHQEAAPQRAPERRAAAKPAPRKDDGLFNDAQLASIKERLRLTRDQEYYWPQVEAALRAISYKVAKQSGGKIAGSKAVAAIDPNSAEVAQLKSAAIPLIMSMREDQKREVRSLARLMGLEAVASAI